MGGLNLMRWFHYDWAAPGRLGGANFPTRVNDVNGYPDWPDVPDPENRFCNCQSTTAEHFMPLWPFDYDLAPQLPRSRGRSL